jgi:transcriptional regulator with XRE-family HTH domain
MKKHVLYIRNCRMMRKMTQKEMADVLDMSPSGYSKIERDETDITLNRLNQIAEILETDMMTVMGFDPKQVFRQYNNKIAHERGTMQNQHSIADDKVKDEITQLKVRMNVLINRMDEIEKVIDNKKNK